MAAPNKTRSRARRERTSGKSDATLAGIPKLRLWVVYGEGIKFGHGRAELLQMVEARGSISAAATEFGMSYRNLWGYFRDLEQASGAKLLVRHRGSGPNAGTHLSPAGKAFLARYWEFRRAVDAAVAREFTRVYKG
jgi:molybdate transport system regulatory protein